MKNNNEHTSLSRKNGVLHLVAVPIGNPEDITVRAVRLLGEVDLIAAEDMGAANDLLTYHKIFRDVISLRKHNKVYQGKKILEMLKSGKDVAVISGAGLPLVSDPGAPLVRLCIQNDIKISVLPGANAALSGLLLSGFSPNTFLYLGFIPRNPDQRKALLEGIKEEPHTLIFYESSNVIAEFLNELAEILGNREVCVSRNITKKSETNMRGGLEKISERFSRMTVNEKKGEYVITVEGNNAEKHEYFEIDDAVKEVREKMRSGKTEKEAFSETARKFSISVRAIETLFGEFG